MIEIVSGIEKLEEFCASEITKRLHAGTLHFNTDCSLCSSAIYFFSCFTIAGVRCPSHAFHIRIPAICQNLLE